MKILILSNFYPPHGQGGQELRCSEMVSVLVQRGHEIEILTSRTSNAVTEQTQKNCLIHRYLHLEADPGFWRTAFRFFYRRHHQEKNMVYLRRVFSRFAPDIVFIWGMWNVHRSLPWLAEQLLPNRVVYNFSDYWSLLPDAFDQYWRKPSGRSLTRWPKFILGQIALSQLTTESRLELEFQQVICVSQYMRKALLEKGLPIHSARVINSGVHAEMFKINDQPRLAITSNSNALSLLYVGRLVRDKGVQTIIEALSLLQKFHWDITLQIVGTGLPEFEQTLQNQVVTHDLVNKVFFKGKVSRPQIPLIMAKHDVLVFPSEWEEPFARTVLEAMAAGLLVIGTTTGGTSEILVPEKTGLTFPAGDAKSLAEKIKTVFEKRDACIQLAIQGQQAVFEQFTITRMVNEIESYLQDITMAA